MLGRSRAAHRSAAPATAARGTGTAGGDPAAGTGDGALSTPAAMVAAAADLPVRSLRANSSATLSSPAVRPSTGLLNRARLLTVGWVALLAALTYPFTLKGFNASVTMITSAGANGRALPWITAAISLLIAFAVCDAVRQFIQVRPVATAVGHDPRLGETSGGNRAGSPCNSRRGRRYGGA